ncbi:unnamed protein product [Effrenium voratum]|uniref:Apple domain-containing protein n=1 Tax=Effrenium voratum TaxID=2562239 RepID=A0AA36IT01_9DINO|nr:unnamed protein product [Effrenium voratum]
MPDADLWQVGRGESSVQAVGFLLNHRLFSQPLALEPRAKGQDNFLLVGPKLPDYLAQFQEAIDIVLENLPEVDWRRCANGDAAVTVMARQLRAWNGPRAQDAQRPEEPDDEQDVFMNLPHHDDYWPGADYFVVSDAPYRTLFYPEGPDAGVRRFPAHSVIRYDAQAVHSAPGFCPASMPGAAPVLRTFLRVHAYDPLWSIQRLAHFAPLLQPPGPSEWRRPTPCEAEDVVKTCFDELHPCERCCDLSKGPLGDSACWAGWMNYQKCCGPASRLWAGCGWRRGADLFAHEFFSLEPPRLHSAAQCQQRCQEDSGCGGWTHFPENWEPIGCSLPVAAILGLRRVCVLRITAQAPPTPHAGLIWGPRDCPEPGGCLQIGVDQVGHDMAFLKEVPDAAACRKQCQDTEECRAFTYFPDSYVGDASPRCVMPAALLVWFQNRCLLKIGATLPVEEPQWLPMGNVVSSGRGCPPARPWLRSNGSDPAVDGDYRREHCVTRQPWRLELDAAYTVTRIMLWTGALSTLPWREPLVYEVMLAADGEDIFCGLAEESLGGHAVVVHCSETAAGRAVQAVIVRSAGEDFSLCEIELQVAPVPCSSLLEKAFTIHGHAALLFPPGQARLSELPGAGEACERTGGSFVELQGGKVICVEAGCAPSKCLEDFDAHTEIYAPLAVLGLWNPKLENAALGCDSIQQAPKGRMYEATIMIFNGGRSDVGGEEMTTHWCFCAPLNCADNDAAAVATRLVARQGLTWEALQPNSEVELRNVRALARWEDVKLDFLIAGFARSGTHSVRGNLMQHPEVKIAEQELTFNWAALPQQLQVWNYMANFREESRPRLWGGKGEGVALSRRVLRLASKIPNLRLIIMVREPVEWLESLYNLRKFECLYHKTCPEIPTLEDVVLHGATFEDVKAEDAFLSQSLEQAVKFFPPSSGRLLLLEFELLRSRPREAFDRITTFLGLRAFPPDFEFSRHATEDRQAYDSMGQRESLCSERLLPVLEVFKERMARNQEHARLVALLAQAGAPWVSSRLLLNRTHCD